MRDLTQAEVQAFLADLSELTKRHGISIHGCGCCGSPYIQREECNSGHYATSETDGLVVENVKWRAGSADD